MKGITRLGIAIAILFSNGIARGEDATSFLLPAQVGTFSAIGFGRQRLAELNKQRDALTVRIHKTPLLQQSELRSQRSEVDRKIEQQKAQLRALGDTCVGNAAAYGARIDATTLKVVAAGAIGLGVGVAVGALAASGGDSGSSTRTVTKTEYVQAPPPPPVVLAAPPPKPDVLDATLMALQMKAAAPVPATGVSKPAW